MSCWVNVSLDSSLLLEGTIGGTDEEEGEEGGDGPEPVGPSRRETGIPALRVDVEGIVAALDEVHGDDGTGDSWMNGGRLKSSDKARQLGTKNSWLQGVKTIVTLVTWIDKAEEERKSK